MEISNTNKDNNNEIIQITQEILEHQRKIEKLRIEITVLIKKTEKLDLNYILYNI